MSEFLASWVLPFLVGAGVATVNYRMGIRHGYRLGYLDQLKEYTEQLLAELDRRHPG